MAIVPRKPRKSGSENRARTEELVGVELEAERGQPLTTRERTMRRAILDVGEPPPDPVRRVEWANHLAAVLAWEIATDFRPTQAGQQRRAKALEAVRTIGMTAVKALYETRLQKLEAKVYGKRKAAKLEDDGLDEIPGA